MPFKFLELDINGLFIIEPKIFGDSRGYFFESYNENDFFKAGIKERFFQDNQSKSLKGVLRGLHFQKKFSQAKLVRVLEGEVYDVAVDLRNDSLTFAHYYGVILSEENKKQFFIPKGFAHGFLVLSESATFSYKCSDFYHVEDESGIIYNDKTININWKHGNYLISDKDFKLNNFDINKKYFSKDGKWIGE